MKIITDLPQEHEGSVRQEQVAKQQREYKLIGSQRKVAGYTLFELNRKTKEIKPADIHRECIIDASTGNPIYKTKTDVHEGCFYIQALNIKNAEKKLRKLGML